MLRLLLSNLRYRLLDWLRKPRPADVPRWTLRQIQEQPEPMRRPRW